MHIEVLVEDSSGAKLIEALLPTVIGAQPHTWRIHDYKGIGRIPQGLSIKDSSSASMVIDQPKVGLI